MSETVASGDNYKQEHDEVVLAVCQHNSANYVSLNNLDGEKHHVSGLFPDILLQDKLGNLIFIIEVRRNGGIAQCIQQWKSVSQIPGILYILVPEQDLGNAKSIAQVVGLTCKFGSYRRDPETQKIAVKYE